MAKIKKDFGEGGANTVPGGSGGEPTLAESLRDVADDLESLQPAVVAHADAAHAAGANPTKAEFDALVDLVNEMKASVNAPAGATIKTTKG